MGQFDLLVIDLGHISAWHAWSLQEAHAQLAALWVQGVKIIGQQNATLHHVKCQPQNAPPHVNSVQFNHHKSEYRSMSDSITRHKTNSI